MSGVSPTTISLSLRGKRENRPALAVRLIEGLERAFVRNRPLKNSMERRPAMGDVGFRAPIGAS